MSKSSERVKAFRERRKKEGKLSYDPKQKNEYQKKQRKENKAHQWLDNYMKADEKGKQELVKKLNPSLGKPFKLLPPIT